MKIITGLVKGPFKDEAEFKAAYLKVMRKRFGAIKFFEIESAETEVGIPDILAASYGQPAVFTELKHVKKDGLIKFTADQPIWYKKNADLRVQILVWDSRNNLCLYLDPADVVKAKTLSMKVPPLDEVVEMEFDTPNV